jgi:predicted DCC family thiol-disulfide oxidoreductase YuxK
LVAAPPAKPLMVYDGDCGFCRRSIRRWRRLTGGTVDYVPYQEIAERFPSIPRRAFQHAVQLVEPDGRVSGGAEAVLRALALAGRSRWLLAAYRSVPGFRPVSETVYRWVASHRLLLSRLLASLRHDRRAT